MVVHPKEHLKRFKPQPPPPNTHTHTNWGNLHPGMLLGGGRKPRGPEGNAHGHTENMHRTSTRTVNQAQDDCFNLRLMLPKIIGVWQTTQIIWPLLSNAGHCDKIKICGEYLHSSPACPLEGKSLPKEMLL